MNIFIAGFIIVYDSDFQARNIGANYFFIRLLVLIYTSDHWRLGTQFILTQCIRYNKYNDTNEQMVYKMSKNTFINVYVLSRN